MTLPTVGTAGATTGGRERERPVLTALIVLTGVFLSSLDLFIVNIAFPSISKAFHGESLSSLSWVLSAYTIVFAAVLVPAGRWADRAGRKRAFLLGLAIFTTSSALCAIAPSLDFLVGARVLQAVGGALDAAYLARPSAPRLRARAQGRGDRAVVGGRRGGSRARASDRGAARPGELALGLPREPAVQPAGALLRCPVPPRGPGSRSPQVGPAGRGAPHCVRRQRGGRHRRGFGLGLDQCPDHRNVRAGRGLRHLAGPALLPPSQPGDRAGGHPSPRRRAGRLELSRLLRRVRRAGARGGPLPHRRVARVGVAGRLPDRPGAAPGRSGRVPRRSARRAFRAPGGRDRGLVAVRVRRGVVDHPCRRVAGLGGRLPAGQPAQRARCRPDAALARRRGDCAASSQAIRHRLGPLRHVAPDRHRARGWRASSPSWAPRAACPA